MDYLHVLICAMYENVTEYVILPTILFGKCHLKEERGRITPREYPVCRAADVLLIVKQTSLNHWSGDC
jgi:hypothetical protein